MPFNGRDSEHNGTDHRSQSYQPTAAEVEEARRNGVEFDFDALDADGEPEDWGDLAPAPWPARPVEAYHGIAGEMVGAVECETEADPTAILGQFLVAVGNAAGRGPHFIVGVQTHHANVNALIVGRSSRARKGTSWSWPKVLMADADKTWSRRCVIDGLSTKEGIARLLREQEDKRLLAVEEELAEILQHMKREGNTLSTAIRKLFDRDDIRVPTRGEPLDVRGVHFSLIGHITQADLSADFTETLARNGWGNRMLWLRARRSRIVPVTKEPPDLRPFARRLSPALTAARRARRRYEFAPDALALWSELYKPLTDDHPGMFGELTSRAEAIVPRLALIYAIVDGSAAIGLAHLRAALSLWRYNCESVSSLFGREAVSKCAVALLGLLAHAGPEGLTQREAHTALSHLSRGGELRKAVVELLRLDRVSVRRLKPHGLRIYLKELPGGTTLRARRAQRAHYPGASP